MGFTSPSGLLLLAAVPIAALLLLRRLRRRERPAAAFFLLRDLVDALALLPRSFLWRQRLRVALFLLALTCAALAAGGLVLGNADDPPQRVVIVLDHLALRRDAEGRPADWQRVTEAAAGLARNLRTDDRVLVVRPDTGLLGGGPLQPRQAATLIAGLRPSALPSDTAATMDLLALLERIHAPSLVAVVTPSPVRWRPHIADRGPAWRILPVPSAAAGTNHAILDAEVRPDLMRAGRVALFFRVGSLGEPGPATDLGLTVTLDGREIARRSFRLAPGETRAEVFPDLETGAGLLEVALSPTDAFPDDNHFLTPVRERVTVPALLVTEENPPLEAALRALPGLELTVARASAGVPGSKAVVRVYDGVAPPGLAGNLLVVAPPEGMHGIGYRGDLPFPSVVRADTTHFLLQGVSLANLRVRRLLSYEVPSGLEVLASADGRPLIAAGRMGGKSRLVLLAFDPRDTEWVYDPSFPILVANIAAWLAESPEGSRSSFVVGDFLPQDLAGDVRGIVDSAGGRPPAPPGGWGGFRFPAPGRWRIEGRTSQSSGEVVVNLLDESVSASQAPQPPDRPAAPPPPPPAPRPFRAEARNLFLAAALVLLLLEQLVAPPLRAGRLP